MNNIVNRLAQLNEELLFANQIVSNSPAGKLTYQRQGNSYKFFCKTKNGTPNGKRKYINKKNYVLASQLAKKDYYVKKIRDLTREKTAIESYLKYFDGKSESEALLGESAPHRELLSEIFRPILDELSDWQNEQFESTASNPQGRVVRGPKEMLRSKSEAFIAWSLFRNCIPYRYECDLVTEFVTIHPDFTIRHPVTGELFIWEHFGLMDNEDYARNAFLKLQTLYSAGYIPMVNFITTFETQNHPLDITLVEKLVKHYFLE